MRESSSNLSDTGKLIGRVFDNRYQIVELIGRGGMSAVYKAIQLSMGKTVAIKVMARSLAEDDRLLQRFNQEALASSRLRHPNTIKVFDYGQSEDGHLFLAMELLEGRTLGQVIRTDSPMDPLRTCKIARQVCKSLAEAHRAGIVHRDLKPDNVFLSDIYGERDFVKVLDFGIAKFVTEGTQETLTQTGFICGTPLYLSPEQGLAKALDYRTDLYSLGIILYEMLVGITPFRADTPIGVVMKHIHEPVVPFQEMNPHVHSPGGLEQLVMRLLEKDPGRRPATSEEVGATLEELMSAPEMSRGGRERPPKPPQGRAAEEPENMTMMAAPQRVAGHVVSMHLNARPTMFLPADQLPDPSLLREELEPEPEPEESGRTLAVPEPWPGDGGSDEDWEERTMLLSADGLAQHDPDRTEFMPVTPGGPAVEDETRLLSRADMQQHHQDATTSGVPAVEPQEQPSRAWIWAVAAMLLLGGGASIYFLTDWLRATPGEAAMSGELAAAGTGSVADGAAPTGPAAETPEQPSQGAEPQHAAGPGSGKAEAPPTAPAPGAEPPVDAPQLGETPRAAAPGSQERLLVTITTQPPGAEVREGVVIVGNTPFELSVPRTGAPRNLVLRLEGHKDEQVLVDPMLVRSGGQIEVKLNALEVVAAPKAPLAVQKTQPTTDPPPPAAASDGSKSAGEGKTPPSGMPPPSIEPPKKPAKGTKKGGKKPTRKPKGGGDMEWKDW